MEDVYALLTELWLVWLLLLFIGIVVWVFWPGHKRRLERHGRIPLDDGEEPGPPGRRNGDRPSDDRTAQDKDRE
jgi:cytochrome c oxidase cbb3-type subunit 4